MDAPPGMTFRAVLSHIQRKLCHGHEGGASESAFLESKCEFYFEGGAQTLAGPALPPFSQSARIQL